MKPIVTTLVCNQIIPYRIPVFNALAADSGIDLEVIYLSRMEKNRQWNLEQQLDHKHKVLESWSAYVTSRDWPIHIHHGLGRALAERKPDAVVTMGYDSPGFWQAALWASRHDAKRILYMGSTAMSSRSRGGIIGALRKKFIRDTDAFLAYGTWARDYLISLGARWDDIYLGMNTVDVHAIVASVAKVEPQPRAAETEILYVGQLIARKGVAVLIDGLAKVPHDRWRLHLVGSGPQELELREKVARLHLGGKVVFHGYKQQGEMPPIMAGCDVLVMPSQLEVWGLVVNEALAAGLFVIAGQTAGAVPDLIEPGVNGFTVDAGDANHMAEVLARAMATPKDRTLIQQSVMPFTPQRTAGQLANAIRHAVGRREAVAA